LPIVLAAMFSEIKSVHFVGIGGTSPQGLLA